MPQELNWSRLPRQVRGGEGRSLEKIPKTRLQLRAADANTSPGDGWAAAPPTFTAPLDFPAKDSVCTELSGGRRRSEARGCARESARAAAERLPCREPSLGLREVLESQQLAGPATHGAVCRRPPPTTRSSSAPAHLARPRRALSISPAPAHSPSRPLSGRARPLAPDLASEPPGARTGTPHPAPRAPRGGLWLEQAPEPGRPQRVPSGRRGSAPCAQLRALGLEVPAGARLLSAPPFGCQRPGGWRRTPRRGQLAPRWVGGSGKAPPGRSAPSPCAWGSGTLRRAGGGRGDPCGVSLASPSYCSVALSYGSAGQGGLEELRARGPESRCWWTPGATRVGELRERADRSVLQVKRCTQSGPLSSKRSTRDPALTWDG